MPRRISKSTSSGTSSAIRSRTSGPTRSSGTCCSRRSTTASRPGFSTGLTRLFGLKPLAFLVQDLIEELGRRGIGSLGELIAGTADAAPFACMLEPPAMDHRITVQSAAFTISSDTSSSFDAFLAEQGLADALTEIVIPAGAVNLIRDQLDICAIDERRLFPDLDGAAREVRRNYASSASERAVPAPSKGLRSGAPGP